jgi:hypothetical protein
MTKKVLASHHETMLREESGITQEVIDTRGYRTVDTKRELKRLGFSERQCNKPGLLIPVYSPTGDIATYQYRPDKPRIDKKGRPIKYETPSGTRMVLDVHPVAQEMLGNPSIPLFITEGLKKSDALVSRGLCAVTLLGVWSWRGTNEHGGKTALYEWDYVALNNGRRVYIVFDSDVMLKPGVHEALRRVKALLESR